MFKRQLFPFFFFFSGSLFSVDKAFRSLFAVHSTLCGFSQWRTESLLLFSFSFSNLFSSFLFCSLIRISLVLPHLPSRMQVFLCSTLSFLCGLLPLFMFPAPSNLFPFHLSANQTNPTQLTNKQKNYRELE